MEPLGKGEGFQYKGVISTPSAVYTVRIRAMHTGEAVDLLLKAHPWAEWGGNSWRVTPC